MEISCFIFLHNSDHTNIDPGITAIMMVFHKNGFLLFTDLFEYDEETREFLRRFFKTGELWSAMQLRCLSLFVCTMLPRMILSVRLPCSTPKFLISLWRGVTFILDHCKMILLDNDRSRSFSGEVFHHIPAPHIPLGWLTMQCFEHW